MVITLHCRLGWLSLLQKRRKQCADLTGRSGCSAPSVPEFTSASKTTAGSAAPSQSKSIRVNPRSVELEDLGELGLSLETVLRFSPITIGYAGIASEKVSACRWLGEPEAGLGACKLSFASNYVGWRLALL
jgi:hypothetical protein